MKTATAASVDLVLPLAKEYAQVLRLAVAGIASRLDFSWEQVEDIKMAAEEAYLLAMQADSARNVHFNFLIKPEKLAINLLNAYLGSFDLKAYEQKYSFFIMTGLVDKVDIIPRRDNFYDIKLVKNLF